MEEGRSDCVEEKMAKLRRRGLAFCRKEKGWLALRRKVVVGEEKSGFAKGGDGQVEGERVRWVVLGVVW